MGDTSMRLCIKQKVFSWADKFTVTDEIGQDRYVVEGELFSWGKKLHVMDMAGGEAAFIQQKVWSFKPRFYVFINGQQIAEIVKEITFLRPKYSIAGLGWEIEGNFTAHDYQITQQGRPVVSIHKEWFTWGDCYVLDVASGEDEILALAVVLAIDCVTAQAAAANT